MLAKDTEQRSPNTYTYKPTLILCQTLTQQHKLSFFLPRKSFSIPILTSHQMKHFLVNQNRHNSNLVYWLRGQKGLLYFTSLKTNSKPQCEHGSDSSNQSKQRTLEPTFTTTSQRLMLGSLYLGDFICHSRYQTLLAKLRPRSRFKF